MQTQFSSLISILDLKNKVRIMSLLKQYRDDVQGTARFMEEVELTQTNGGNILITFIPKSAESWTAYNKNERSQLETWFKENLLDTGLVEVIDSWIVFL